MTSYLLQRDPVLVTVALLCIWSAEWISFLSLFFICSLIITCLISLIITIAVSDVCSCKECLQLSVSYGKIKILFGLRGVFIWKFKFLTSAGFLNFLTRLHHLVIRDGTAHQNLRSFNAPMPLWDLGGPRPQLGSKVLSSHSPMWHDCGQSMYLKFPHLIGEKFALDTMLPTSLR